ncbi:MAG: hypothetical protein JNK46_00320 [Methylobacteriaceae bacterium]|nr:hypothetical protein [Methylobacteriaceae bacterium]
MAHLLKLPNDSAGYDRDAYALTMTKNATSVFYLVASDGLTPKVTAAAGEEASDIVSAAADSKGVAELQTNKYVSEWERGQSLKRIVLRSGGKTGQARLRAQLEDGRDWIKPLPIFVVEDRYGRRGSDTSGVEPEFAKELELLPIRKAIARLAAEQMASKVRTNAEALDAYHHPYPNPPDDKWCGSFVAWCWNLLSKLRKDVPAGLFGSGDPLRSPEKAIDWAVKNSGKFKLLRYEGPNPMTLKEKVAYAEIGADGVTPQCGDVVLWRNKSGFRGDDPAKGVLGFQHVALLESFSGKTFVDINGNAYDADAASPFARIEHDLDSKTTMLKAPRAFFLCVRGL